MCVAPAQNAPSPLLNACPMPHADGIYHFAWWDQLVAGSSGSCAAASGLGSVRPVVDDDDSQERSSKDSSSEEDEEESSSHHDEAASSSEDSDAASSVGRTGAPRPPAARASSEPHGRKQSASKAVRAAASGAAGSGGSDVQQLLLSGYLQPGDGVLHVKWTGVRVPPAANLHPNGDITLPKGTGREGECFTLSGLLRFLIKDTKAGRRLLPGWEKGNGFTGVHYGHLSAMDGWRSLDEL